MNQMKNVVGSLFQLESENVSFFEAVLFSTQKFARIVWADSNIAELQSKAVGFRENVPELLIALSRNLPSQNVLNFA